MTCTVLLRSLSLPCFHQCRAWKESRKAQLEWNVTATLACFIHPGINALADGTCIMVLNRSVDWFEPLRSRDFHSRFERRGFWNFLLSLEVLYYGCGWLTKLARLSSFRLSASGRSTSTCSFRLSFEISHFNLKRHSGAIFCTRSWISIQGCHAITSSLSVQLQRRSVP